MPATTEQRALNAAKANADPVPIEDAIWIKYRVKIEIVEFDDDPSGYAWIAYHTPDGTDAALFLHLPDKQRGEMTPVWCDGLDNSHRFPNQLAAIVATLNAVRWLDAALALRASRTSRAEQLPRLA